MGKPLSMDLRHRVLAAIDGGMSRRAAAGHFGVSASSAVRWDGERRRTGTCAPKPQGGDRRSRKTGMHAAMILGALEETPDITLMELRACLDERGIAVSISALWRFLKRHGMTRKKRLAMRSNRIARRF